MQARRTQKKTPKHYPRSPLNPELTPVYVRTFSPNSSTDMFKHRSSVSASASALLPPPPSPSTIYLRLRKLLAAPLMPFFRPPELEPYSFKGMYLCTTVLTQLRSAFFHGLYRRHYDLVARGRYRLPLLPLRSKNKNAAAVLACPRHLLAVSSQRNQSNKVQEFNNSLSNVTLTYSACPVLPPHTVS